MRAVSIRFWPAASSRLTIYGRMRSAHAPSVADLSLRSFASSRSRILPRVGSDARGFSCPCSLGGFPPPTAAIILNFARERKLARKRTARWRIYDTLSLYSLYTRKICEIVDTATVSWRKPISNLGTSTCECYDRCVCFFFFFFFFLFLEDHVLYFYQTCLCCHVDVQFSHQSFGRRPGGLEMFGQHLAIGRCISF
jgi:hypothetical protein